MIRNVLFTLLTVSFLNATSQGITGSWEGIMDHEKLQLNVQLKNGRLCGYTYDHFLNDRSQFCRAYFTGTYDRESRIYTFTGTKFISNSGSHSLIRLKVRMERIKGEIVLRGIVATKSAFMNMMAMGGSTPIILRRVSKTPKPLADGMPVCETPDIRKPAPKPTVPTPLPKKQEPKKPVPPPVKKEEPKPITKPKTEPVTPKKVEQKKDTPAIAKPSVPSPGYKTRANKEIRRIEVDVPVIKIKVYDNGVVDGDTVSIYFNDKLIVDRQLLSESPIELELQLNESWSNNELLLYAHNLGSIPPNTAIIIVTAGKQRYELLSGQDLKQNSVLYFDYKPGR